MPGIDTIKGLMTYPVIGLDDILKNSDDVHPVYLRAPAIGY